MNMMAADSLEQTSRWERLTLVSGIVYSVAQIGVLGYFATAIFPKMGPIDAAVTERAAAYVQVGEALRLGNYLLTLPTPFFLLFLGGMYSVLRRAEDQNSALAMSAVGAGIAMAMLWPMSAVIDNIAIDIAQVGGDAATIASFDAIGPYMLALSTLPRAVLLAATSFALLQGHLTPRWMGWLGLLLACASLIGSATLINRNLFPLLALGTLLFDFWIIAVSGALLRRYRRQVSQAALQSVPV